MVQFVYTLFLGEEVHGEDNKSFARDLQQAVATRKERKEINTSLPSLTKTKDVKKARPHRAEKWTNAGPHSAIRRLHTALTVSTFWDRSLA